MAYKKKRGFHRKYLVYSWAVILGITAFVIRLYTFNTSAATTSLTTAAVRFDRIQTSLTDTRVLVKFTPNDTTSLATVRIDFDDAIPIDGTAANITTSTTSLPAECTALTVTNSQASAANATTHVVDFAVSGVSSTSTQYCFYITAGIDTPPTIDTEYTSVISTRDASTELGQLSVVNYFITNDQVNVSAVVPAAFSFTLSDNTTAFTSNLSSTSITSTTPVTGTMISNAANGWTAFLKNTGMLHSTAANYDINTFGVGNDNTPTTISTVDSNEYYQLDVDEIADGNNNGSVAAEYNGGASQGGTFNSSDYQIIASGTAPTTNYQFNMVGKSRITGLTKAANDYADTWTVIISGNF